MKSKLWLMVVLFLTASLMAGFLLGLPAMIGGAVIMNDKFYPSLFHHYIKKAGVNIRPLVYLK